MGTYTTNYQLYTPTVGETGWGTLVNGNFTTIDTAMKSLSNRITAVENEVTGALSCTSVTTSGKVTGNGGIAGTTGAFSGAVTGSSFNQHVFKNNGVYIVTGGTTTRFYIPMHSASTEAYNQSLTLLPVDGNNTYTGNINFFSDSKTGVSYCDGIELGRQALTIEANTITTLNFTNIRYLTVAGTTAHAQCYAFTIT